MNSQILKLFILFSIVALFVSCDKTPTEVNTKNTYTELKLLDLFSYSKDSISNSLAKALHVYPISFQKIVSTNDLSLKTGIQWIKEGYEYYTNDSAKITVWTDSSNQPYQVAYELERLGTSADWSYEQNKADSLILSVLENIGIDVTEEASFKSDKYAMASNHWYNIELYQKFKDETLEYPFIHAEVEGGVAQINFLCIHRWYVNLNEVNQLVADDELKKIAMNYFNSSKEVLMPPDSIEIFDVDIISNKVCKRLGSAIIDVHGSTMNLYIDIQDGNIVDVERYKRR